MSNVLQNTGGNTLKVHGGGVFGSAAAAVVSAPAANLFYDGFETGDMTAPNGPSPALNATTFAWGGLNRTSIVTGAAGANSQIWPSVIAVNDTRDWAAHTGDNSLRFRFPSSDPLEAETLAEQRWSIPLASGQTDLWIRYQFRVPTNFYHDPANANSKFMALWANDYTLTGTGCVWNLRPVSSNGSARLMCSYALGNQIPSAGSSGEQPLGNFIDITTDQGLWFQMVLRFKAATADGANNGEIHTYYKKEGQSVFTEMTALTGLNTYIGAGLTGMRGGYIFGSHRGYAVDTEFLVDNFELSSSSLI